MIYARGWYAIVIADRHVVKPSYSNVGCEVAADPPRLYVMQRSPDFHRNCRWQWRLQHRFSVLDKICSQDFSLSNKPTEYLIHAG
jgi:hypothetical protein